MVRAVQIAMVAVMCSALLLHPVAAYNFNFGGGGLLLDLDRLTVSAVFRGFFAPVAGVSSQLVVTAQHCATRRRCRTRHAV